MANPLDILDNSYSPTSAYSFEFRERNSLTGKVGPLLTELFFLLPPENYTIQEGYKITVNKTINGAWVDDFGNDVKDIKISGSLYSYYIGTPAKTSFRELSLPPLIRNLKNKALGIGDDFKKLAGSFASQIGIDIPGLEIISGLDEFFKLRYILSRFRDTRTLENLTADQAIIKKFPDMQVLLVMAQRQKKLFTDIAVIYHDYDDNNHYEVTFNNFNMSRSAKDPFTIMYNIHLTGLKEFNNQYAGIGESKRKEDPFALINSITNSIIDINSQLLAITNLPSIVLTALTEVVNIASALAESTKEIISNLGIDALNEIAKIAQNGKDLVTAAFNFKNIVTDNAFLDKIGETLNEILEKYKNEEDDYLITDDNFLRSLTLSRQLENNGIALSGIEKYFTEFISELTFEQTQTLNEDDFDIKINETETKQENGLSSRDQFYYQIVQGDTLQSLSNVFYGNYEQYTIIAEVNDISNKNFENDGMVGKNIIIPSLFEISSKESNYNLIYYLRSVIATPKERQIQILGNDLDLNKERQFIIDGSGDLGLIYGEDCFFENMIDRIKFPIKSLNPVHPNWGIELEIGNVPSSIVLTKLYNSIEQQISLDPRTEYVYINRETSSNEADILKIDLFYKPINGTEKTINISDIVAGLLI